MRLVKRDDRRVLHRHRLVPSESVVCEVPSDSLRTSFRHPEAEVPLRLQVRVHPIGSVSSASMTPHRRPFRVSTTSSPDDDGDADDGVDRLSRLDGGISSSARNDGDDDDEDLLHR